jgi:peptidyl-prolyl cis-trans isomerase C
MKFLAALAFAFAICALAGCGERREIVAKVDGAPIYRDQLEHALAYSLVSRGRDLAALDAAGRRALSREVLEELILDRVLSVRAAKTVVPPEELERRVRLFEAQFGSATRLEQALRDGGVSLKEMRERLHDTARQLHWIDSRLGEPNVTDAEAREYYDSHPAAFDLPETVRASHILVLVSPEMDAATVEFQRQKAEGIMARILAGESFERLAVELSEDPTAIQNKGDLNYFSRHRMEPPVAAAAFAVQTGELAGPVRSKFGFHLIKVTDRKPARRLSFMEARPEILTQLRDERRRAAVAGLFAKIRAETRVTIRIPD